MKSYNHLMEQYLSEDNYYLAVRNATKHKGGKKRKYQKARYYKNNAEKLKKGMLNYAEHFKSAKHTPKSIYDGIRRKQRFIIVPTMREQVVHHMVVNVLKPIFMRSMYEHSYGSIPDRGPHLAKRRIEKWIRYDSENVKYCLKLDIKKYFDSIPHDILKQKLANLIHDKAFLNVLYEIIDTTEVGIPIGFYTSQWIANWYLTELDYYIKCELHAKHYVRYMDDMIIFSSSKEELHEAKNKIEEYLNAHLGLRLKENWQVYLFDEIQENGTRKGRDLDFMGFRFFRDKTILRKTIMLKATRKALKICKKKFCRTIHDCRQMLSYLGWLSCTDTYSMYKRRIKSKVSFRAMTRYESRCQRKQNEREKQDVVQKREWRICTSG